MATLEEVRRLARGGRFALALRQLSDLRTTASERPEFDVLRVELLEHAGRHSESSSAAHRLFKQQELSPAHRSDCELVLGLIAWNEGETETATLHLQRSVSAAKTAGDLFRTCWSQLRLMVAIAGQGDSQTVLPLLAEIRWNVLRLGDPLVLAALHVFVGGMEARRGLLQSARRHTGLGQALLEVEDNPWLEAIAENHLVGVSLATCDFSDGMIHAQRALLLAEESGDAALRRACLGNLGNLYCESGEFDRTVEHFERADALLPSSGEFSAALHESVAKVYLVRGDIDAAAAHLELIEDGSKGQHLLYPYRHALLTRTQLLSRQGRRDEALKCVESVIRLARDAGDALLAVNAEIVFSDLLHQRGQSDDSVRELEGVARRLHSSPPDVHAHYERALACALARTGESRVGRSHYERALRIYEGLHSAPGVLDLNRAWAEAVETGGSGNASEAGSAPQPGTLLQNIAALLMHAGRPELLARDIVAVLADSGVAVAAHARTRADDGAVEQLAGFGPAIDEGEPQDRTLAIGSARSRAVEVILRARRDLESEATVHAVSLLLDTVRELEQARDDREQSQTLWPIEELPLDGDEAVVTGQMRKVMMVAQRVARTNASVLITGESGTGKEILARAVHTHSARSGKPFVPFNCTAVPRDLLESQLFGHRRGAFTGADRDYAGLIRTARDGTLFLDEIGEMGLDLQPKLLRFLESGEISPLGEPAPLTVNVRVVAATNANLDDMVQQGRFREDLFYRLNVIRLTIPPLRERRDEIPALVHHFVARAAVEFSKGRIRVPEETLDHILLYDWPGNVRQLQNEIRRMVALADNDTVLPPSALSPELRRATSKAAARSAPGTIALAIPPGEKLTPAISRIEREMIRAALRASQGRVDAAARALGISRKGLYLKRQRLGL